jgi:hypothetical protein
MAFENKEVAALLKDLNLGSSVAEFDGLLETARIETSAFSDLFNDRVDLIPGTKGSGKSALFRMFVEFLPGILLSQRKVVVAHGVQAPGDPVFQAFAEQFAQLSEDDFVDFWCIYLVSLAHEQFIKAPQYKRRLERAHSDINAFTAACNKAGIPNIQAEKSLKDILGWALRALARWRPKLTHKLPHGAGEIELDLFGNPKDAAEKTTSDETSKQLPNYVSEIRESLDRVLASSRLSLWLMVDRLDEVFPRRSETERRALRGLLRAMKFFSSSSIRVKVFLRDDMLDHVVNTSEGFTALTHLTARQADTLRWTEEQILAMLAKRVFSSAKIAEYLTINPARVYSSATYRAASLQRMFPKTVYRGTRQSRTLKWIYDRCADGRGVVTPRDVLDLLIRAKQRQEDICSGDLEGSTDGIIGSAAIQYGLEELSIHKRRTYLQAEFPHLWVHMEKFVGGKTEYGESALSALLDAEWQTAAEDLVAIGFLTRKSPANGDMYRVPYLYRHGLDLTQGKA